MRYLGEKNGKEESNNHWYQSASISGSFLLPKPSDTPLKPEALHPEGCYQLAYSKAISANESPLESELASLSNNKSLLISDCL